MKLPSLIIYIHPSLGLTNGAHSDHFLSLNHVSRNQIKFIVVKLLKGDGNCSLNRDSLNQGLSVLNIDDV